MSARDQTVTTRYSCGRCGWLNSSLDFCTRCGWLERPLKEDALHPYLEKVAEANKERMDKLTSTAPDKTDPRGSVLTEAEHVVNGARRKDYGSPLENHERTAKLWSAYLGVAITAEDVCMLNILQKVSRQRHAPKRDNLVDIAGYAANVELVEEGRKKP